VKNESPATNRAIGAIAPKTDKSRVDLAGRTGVEDLDVKPVGRGGLLDISQSGLGVRSTGRIEQHCNANRLGHQIVQKAQPLGRQLVGEKVDTGRVAAGPSQAGNKSKVDRVFADTEDDRDGSGCSLEPAVVQIYGSAGQQAQALKLS
jgi:hypothetical protein